MGEEYIDIDKIKAIRELNRIVSELTEKGYYNNPINTHTNSNKKFVKILLDIFEYLDEPYIYQSSRFGFEIEYVFYNKAKIIYGFDESSLPKGVDRYYMDKLILGERNREIFKKYNKKSRLYKLSEIDY
jgi:hypothetical protein